MPVLSKRELARVSGIRVLLRVDHKVGTMHDDSADLTGQIQVSGSSGSDSIGATQLLTGGARGDAVDGRCGALGDEVEREHEPRRDELEGLDLEHELHHLHSRAEHRREGTHTL